MDNDFIELFNLQYRYAKTYPQCPHFYIVKQNLERKHKVLFDRFSQFMEKEGEGVYIRHWYKTPYRYYNFGGYKYWVIEDILNRTPLTVEQLKKDLEGVDTKGVDIEELCKNHIKTNLYSNDKKDDSKEEALKGGNN